MLFLNFVQLLHITVSLGDSHGITKRCLVCVCVCVWGGGGGGGGSSVSEVFLEGGGGAEACHPGKIRVLVTLRYRKVDLKLTNSVLKRNIFTT